MAAKKQPHLADPDVNPSFTKSLFLGELREELIVPFPKPGEEDAESQRMIVDSFRSWAEGAVDAKKHDREGKFADGVREGMAELGLMGLNIPEEYGGFGASAKVFTNIFCEIGATDGALAVYFGETLHAVFRFALELHFNFADAGFAVEARVPAVM